jgi:hypothetical protein
LTGYFPTRPLQINFDLIFQSVAGQWRLFGISIATPEAPTATAGGRTRATEFTSTTTETDLRGEDAMNLSVQIAAL